MCRAETEAEPKIGKKTVVYDRRVTRRVGEGVGKVNMSPGAKL